MLVQRSGYPQRACCGGARAGSSGAGVSGRFRCWRIGRMVAACVKYASTRRLPHTPGAAEDVQRERPAQQPGPRKARRALLLRFRCRRRLRRWVRRLFLRFCPRQGEHPVGLNPKVHRASKGPYKSADGCAAERALERCSAWGQCWNLTRSGLLMEEPLSVLCSVQHQPTAREHATHRDLRAWHRALIPGERA